MARPTKKTASPARKAVASRAPAKTAAKAAPKAPARTGAKPVATSKAAAAKAVAKPAAAKVAPAKPKAAATMPKAPPKPSPPPVVHAPAAPKPPRKRIVRLSEKELASIREELVAQRATLAKEFEDLEVGSLHVAQSELSGEVSFDEEYADAGTFTFERERDLSLSNNIRDLMDKVDSALRKVADGSYGVCERCGNGIDKQRLRALPYSVLCITCKQAEERFR